MRGGLQSVTASGPAPGNQSRLQIASGLAPRRGRAAHESAQAELDSVLKAAPCSAPRRRWERPKSPSRTRFRAQGCALFGALRLRTKAEPASRAAASAPPRQLQNASAGTQSPKRRCRNAHAKTPPVRAGLAAFNFDFTLFSRANARPRKRPHRTVFRTSLLSKQERKGDGLRGGFQSLAASGPAPGNQSRRQIASGLAPRRGRAAHESAQAELGSAPKVAPCLAPRAYEQKLNRLPVLLLQRRRASSRTSSPKRRQSGAGLAAFTSVSAPFSRANLRPRKRPHRTVFRAWLLSNQ